MPEPKTHESRKDFLARCIPIVKKEDSSRSRDQAAAICYSKWENRHES